MGNKNKLPDILTKDELIKLFESMFRPKCTIACFVALMCGLRVREVCNLQISDINLERRIIKIRDSKNPNRKKQGNYGKDRWQIPNVFIMIGIGGGIFLLFALIGIASIRKSNIRRTYR